MGRFYVLLGELAHQLHSFVQTLSRVVHFRIDIDQLQQFHSRLNQTIMVRNVNNGRIKGEDEIRIVPPEE